MHMHWNYTLRQHPKMIDEKCPIMSLPKTYFKFSGGPIRTNAGFKSLGIQRCNVAKTYINQPPFNATHQLSSMDNSANSWN